jgi:hypothetical protein
MRGVVGGGSMRENSGANGFVGGEGEENVGVFGEKVDQ